MGQPTAVVLRGMWPRPANFRSGVETTLMTDTADFAVWMLPSRLRNWLVPSQLPTTETVILIPPTTRRRRQVPPTSFIAETVAAFIKLLTVTGWVALTMLLIFGLVWRRVVSFMKWMSADDLDEPDNKQLRTKPAEKATWPTQSQKCVLPAYPENGNYVITNAPNAKPGDSFESLKLTVNCLNGYGVLGTANIFCIEGVWFDPIPECVRFCELDDDTSVNYYCLVNGSIENSRACNRYEPPGTVVKPECNSPNYYSTTILPFMRCINGRWDTVVVCSPECGRVTPNGEELIVGGRTAKRGELPWHVGIYLKDKKNYKQICGGSIISNRLVISAAHCFYWNGEKLLPSQFAVAAGKIYRPWNNHRDAHAQKSDVKDIKIPEHFQGSTASFQSDIAVVILEADFVYNPFVRPICLDLDYNFDRRQLQPGKMGKVAGWGLTAEDGNASQILKVVELPFVNIEQCIAESPLIFREYITSDKICAGSGHGKALCKGDSGGGLAFPESERGVDRYYLRGIVSTAAKDDLHLCNTNTLTTFTHILKHKYFVREYLGSGLIEQENIR